MTVPDPLAGRIAAALRAAAHECGVPEPCTLDETECPEAHPIQVGCRVGGRVEWVDARVDAIARVAAEAVRGE